MVLGLEEFAGVDRAGLYVLRAPCLASPRIYKIGKSLNLRKRLDQYQLYFPYGFLIDLVWIFPRGLKNAKRLLDQTEKFVQERLNMVQTTTRRARTEWSKSSKAQIVDVFIQAFDEFSHIGGQLENPAIAFTITDLTPTETRKNVRERERMREAAKAQLTHIRRAHPDDYEYLCSCSKWAIEKSYRSC